MSMRYTLYNNHLLFSLFLWSCLSIFLIKSDSFLLSLYQRNQLMVTTSSWLNNCWSKFDLKKSACLFFKRIRQAIILKRRNNIQTEHNNNDTVRLDWDINIATWLHSDTTQQTTGLIGISTQSHPFTRSRHQSRITTAAPIHSPLLLYLKPQTWPSIDRNRRGQTPKQNQRCHI